MTSSRWNVPGSCQRQAAGLLGEARKKARGQGPRKRIARKSARRVRERVRIAVRISREEAVAWSRVVGLEVSPVMVRRRL
jgi:hypothetical protein